MWYKFDNRTCESQEFKDTETFFTLKKCETDPFKKVNPLFKFFHQCTQEITDSQYWWPHINSQQVKNNKS